MAAASGDPGRAAPTPAESVKTFIEKVDITVMKCRTCGLPMAQSDSHVMGKPANLDPYYVHPGCMYGEPQRAPAQDPRPKRLLPRI
jgi:hypothetical protein